MTEKITKKITASIKLGQLLKSNPKAAEILFDSGMACVGCSMAMEETLEQGCLAHGMSKSEISSILKKLNK